MITKDKNGCIAIEYIGDRFGYIGVIKYKGEILIPMSDSKAVECNYFPVDDHDRVNTRAKPVIFKVSYMKKLEKGKKGRYYLD